MRVPVVFSALTLSLCAGSAFAVVLPKELDGLNIAIATDESVWESSNSEGWLKEVIPGEKAGTFRVKGAWLQEGEWAVDFDLDIDTDPFIVAGFTVLNLSASPTTFSFLFSSPAIPLPSPTVMEGSVGGTLIDGNFDSTATVETVPGLPLYRASVDGVGVHDEFSDPYSLTTVNVDALPPTNWGPGPGPAVASTISIANDFKLSAGDGFQMLSRFAINAIPTPGALGLLGVAGLSVARRRR